jgi:signal transduction histidine kinase
MTEPDHAPRASARRRLTVQGWQNLVLVAMGVVVLAGAITSAYLLNRTDDVSRELIDNIQPARIASYRLQIALRDQETATRGYAITADRQFLEPYYSGLDAEKAAVDAMHQRLEGRPELRADLDAVEQAAQAWRASYAGPLIASVKPGVVGVIDPATVDRGKTEFDTIRSLSDVQAQRLTAARDVGLANIDTVRGWRDRVLAVVVVAFFVTAILLLVLVNRAVTRPLAMLAEACRRITDGHFDQKIVPRGPKDIRAIATDVENMRQRIVSELEATRAARATLDEQTVELRRSNAELEQFAYVASHDLQEPLRKVASFCQLLEKRYGNELDGRGIEYIAFAVDGAKRMQVLINDLLTFSRVGRLNSTHTDVDLGATLDAALENLATAIDESGAEVTRTGPLPEVIGDPTLLTMLWQNLIGNAVKFRKPDEAPRVVIECAPGVDEQQGQWAFTATDNGIGIAEEFVDKVFVIFQRLHARETYTGTGIGLALCKKIVEHHGGTITIDTSYTAGTRFNFTLPVKPMATADTDAARDEPSAAALEGSSE